MDIFMKENGSFCNSAKRSTTSETTSENASIEAAPAADVAVDKGKRGKTRKYTENHLKFWFTFKETDGIEIEK